MIKTWRKKERMNVLDPPSDPFENDSLQAVQESVHRKERLRKASQR